MEYLKDSIYLSQAITWEEESGFLKFLSIIPQEVKKFNDTFGFGLKYSVIPPEEIDGNSEVTLSVAFVLIRHNELIPNHAFCIYAVLRDRTLYAYSGLYKGDSITTLRGIGYIGNFKKPALRLYDWMRYLVKASCDKY